MSDSIHDHVTIRPAVLDDAQGLLDFIEPFVADRRLVPRTTDELEQLVRTGFVAVVDQKIVGFASLDIYNRKLAEVRSLAVAPIYQGLGIGRSLVQKCVELARERRILEVMAITSSEEFFKNCGFDFSLPRERKALFIETFDETAE
ncbi:MAG: GNAT family N-acetyltransferase [Rubinisphaera brasiliensis]|uniref:GCN5-related N-acetyltransferase n=1 Tax=Rubinisphaera brasiliensis (strain ATCC 49424 / DSM 5305 / JCM 21570 / IAM 15109 / NBRC 103401 / IFAM 1448) TaxID=756272 RepID=F0SIB8_RUBBR|nr:MULTISPECIES: GNAT family N-acetyltransferase [Rubinisphaera]ADY58507.1 GCN5-related N-acetyltransferase [Rubinisphaera brasiliensis DSM 5305]